MSLCKKNEKIINIKDHGKSIKDIKQELTIKLLIICRSIVYGIKNLSKNDYNVHYYIKEKFFNISVYLQ